MKAILLASDRIDEYRSKGIEPDETTLVEFRRNWEEAEYPSTIPTAQHARTQLIERGASAVPEILEVMKSSDLGALEGYCDAYFCNRIMQELTAGTFGDFPIGALSQRDATAAACDEIVACWERLFHVFENDEAFWKTGPGRRVDWVALGRAELPRPFVLVNAVLDRGTTIQGTTPSGKMSITASYGFWREYEWLGERRELCLQVAGVGGDNAIGLCSFGNGEQWPTHDGVTRATIEEATLYFGDSASATQWLDSRSKIAPLVYDASGLMLQWYLVPERRQLTVYLYQLRGAGVDALEFPGASIGGIIRQSSASQGG